MVPVQAGPKSGQMSPKQFEATTTLKRSGFSTNSAVEDVDVVFVPLDVGKLFRHLLDALVQTAW